MTYLNVMTLALSPVLAFIMLGCKNNIGPEVAIPPSLPGRVYNQPIFIRLQLLDPSPMDKVVCAQSLAAMLAQPTNGITLASDQHLTVAVSKGGYSYTVDFFVQYTPALLNSPIANYVDLTNWTAAVTSEDGAATNSQTMYSSRMDAMQKLSDAIDGVLLPGGPLTGHVKRP